MESNEKRAKRPRIGQQPTADANPETTNAYSSSEAPQRQDYQPRQRREYGQPYQQRHDYNSRYNNSNYSRRYNNGDDSNPRDNYRRPRHYDNAAGPDEATGEQRPYQQHRPYRQGGYGNGPRQGGYNSGPRQGGYNNGGNRQGGYNNGPRQGGYSNGPRQGGYNNGGNRQGGYNNGGNRPQRPQRNEFGMPRGGKSFVPRPKRVEYEQSVPDPNEQIRLNKFMANAGICSRREADEYIQQGLVKVNGNTVTELGVKISHSDVVEYNGKVVTLESKCYILLNKPKDCVTTSDDPNGRLTVMDIVKNACPERIYPVGRLDRNTTGVLLLTNDGDLASKLTHPKYVKKKIYHVWTDKDISEEDMQRIADGIELEDGPIHADAISYATETDRNQAGIEIHSGRNRIVRRIFESLGYHVTKLDRVYFAGLTKKNLPRGRWRYLTQEEVNFLKMGSFE
ncbi:MAG: RNA-binding S4 domain-containing protein [Muribaculaceae bacterium]|nr:RNA-binding S4 domain-containing protein [Muribaculaceae bacterium]